MHRDLPSLHFPALHGVGYCEMRTVGHDSALQSRHGELQEETKHESKPSSPVPSAAVPPSSRRDSLLSSASTNSSDSEPSSPSRPAASNCPSNIVIRPRRRAGQPKDEKDCAPITITLDALECLYCMPLNAAAKTVGISVTAFKKVCRTLGVRNWPYRFHDLLQRPTQDEENPERMAAKQKWDFGEPAEDDFLDEVDSEEEASKPPVLESALSKGSEELRALLEHSKSVWGATKSDMDQSFETVQGWIIRPMDLSEEGPALPWGFEVSVGSD